jgi:sulfonate transport system permease protein
VRFPVYINTFVGIRNVDAKLIEAARTFDAGRWRVSRSVIIPGALPNILGPTVVSVGGFCVSPLRIVRVVVGRVRFG